MKLSKALLLLCAVFLFARPAFAIQLECGEYELTGQYHPAQATLIVSPGTDGALPLLLTGPKVLSAFLEEEKKFYSVKIRVSKKLSDSGGAAELLAVLGMELPTGTAHPIKRFTPGACR